jgi:hypothetical protein
MHQQIRTSPHGVDVNIRRALEKLAADGINVEGVGPDYVAPHARIVVPHEAVDAAVRALKELDFDPELWPACTFAVPNRAGQIAPILDRVAARFEIQSVLVLASRHRGMTMVSVGLDREASAQECEDLGCLEEPDGWIGGDIEEPTAS